MREIKFRGKTLNGKWVYGDLHIIATVRPHIHPDPFTKSVIDIKTAGQFTGFRDKNGKEIYQGDIAATDSGNNNTVNMTVGWYADGGYWALREIEGDDTMHFVADYLNEITIIGNVFDNPELLVPQYEYEV